MRKSLIFIILLMMLSPVVLAAGGPGERQYPAQRDITFSSTVERAFDYSGDLVTQVTLPDGTVFASHNGTMQNVTVARMGPDGDIQTLCTSSRAEATAFLAGVGIRSTDPSVDLPQDVK